MIQPAVLDTLIDMADKQAEQLAQRVAAAARAHEENSQKLALLLQYREDYLARYQHGLSQGLGVADHLNFREFLYKLDEAIDGQQTVVNQAAARLDHERSQWQEAERKRLSYSTLSQRAQAQQQLEQTRREQKTSDEYATRMTRTTVAWQNTTTKSEC